MKKIVYCLILVISISGCQDKKVTKTEPEEKVNCVKGKMTRAWYESGQDQSIPDSRQWDEGFSIVIDTSLRSTTFISNDEKWCREYSTELDTFDHNSQFEPDWAKLTTKQKLQRVKSERLYYKKKADSIHQANMNQQQVWIINNSSDTIEVQMQDGSYVCILEAKNKSHKWKPIEFWRFSRCGNSYYSKRFLPKTANSFLASPPKKGDYKTKLRYKLLGADKFYYSNEFDGQIEYCRFLEDSSSFTSRGKPHYKLDTLVNLCF